uniref:NADH-ubiquinone oxidoreductase chain 6 n=1 Tax=Ogataea parapolymorpha (strain ATCC 26012 / BCRC 20466 / JCM 22074 / NRRL Y-7560 / DL-1) TaxID=871575 RepID=E7E840_OGAPD|nr:NADH dehydrogenase subunit 6 [Ogataea polymorpha]ADT63571.1 NADH dehydrogenase subunit 6 [Ogataea polymorpha]
MYIDFNLLDISLLNYYILISSTTFESTGMTIGSIMTVISELWFINSQLFSILYTIIYVGAVVMLFVFILSVINKKEEYQFQYTSLFIFITIIMLDDLNFTYFDISNNIQNMTHIYDYYNLFNMNMSSDLSTMGNLLFTEFSFMLLLTSLILLTTILGIIVVIY